MNGALGINRRLERRGAIKIATACQTLAPYLAVQGFCRFVQPRVGAIHRAKATEKLKQSPKIIFRKQLLGIGAAEEIHVSAGGLLRCIGFQITQESAWMRRIDNAQFAHQLRHLIR